MASKSARFGAGAYFGRLPAVGMPFGLLRWGRGEDGTVTCGGTPELGFYWREQVSLAMVWVGRVGDGFA
ncbi:MAG: hypothetical protein WBQ72_20375 [Terriglobales bacterium]